MTEGDGPAAQPKEAAAQPREAAAQHGMAGGQPKGAAAQHGVAGGRPELPDYLPLSYLNQFEYCQRRFWLMFVLGEMEINAPVLEGTLRHQRAHTPGRQTEGGRTTRRRVYVFSERLRLTGFADMVEEVDGRLVPVEYKRGKMGKWLNDHVQLCAQALCLEERTGRPVPEGEIYYFRSRRRVRVPLTPALRARTEGTVARAFDLLERRQMPPPTERMAKCHDCSLEPVCLPREVRALAKGDR